MKIAIVCSTMQYLSGSPLYHYTLALELAKTNEVHLISHWAMNSLRLDLEDAGVKCINGTDEEYDLAIVSQRDHPIPKADKVLHVIHSEYEVETPRMGMEQYVAIRPSIKEHLIKKHGIDESKIEVIYNGIDLERFKPIKKSERDYIKVVIPATRDSLRQKMFDFYSERASKDFQVYIFGKQFGAVIPSHDYIFQFDEVSNIEEHIGDADLVAGILLGRVNLEARAMDVKSYIHNPDKPEEVTVYYPDRQTFEKNHDIKNVAKQLLEL